MGRPLYTQFSTRTCVLIPTQQDRLIYLANFVIKNYYKKTTYLISDYTESLLLKFAINYNSRSSLDHYGYDLNFNSPDGDMISPDIQVIINGHRYNLS